jgi:hypothetical protein
MDFTKKEMRWVRKHHLMRATPTRRWWRLWQLRWELRCKCGWSDVSPGHTYDAMPLSSSQLALLAMQLHAAHELRKAGRRQ